MPLSFGTAQDLMLGSGNTSVILQLNCYQSCVRRWLLEKLLACQVTGFSNSWYFKCNVTLNPQNWSPVHRSFETENGISHMKSGRNDLAGPVSTGRFPAMNEWNCVPWCLMDRSCRRALLVGCFHRNVSVGSTSVGWGWLLPCLGNGNMTRRTVLKILCDNPR